MTDDGSADPRLAVALAAYDASPPTRAEVLAALVGARVFVPVRAVAAREPRSATTGSRQESSPGSAAQMQLLLLRGSTGTTALPAFPDGHEVQRWQPEARPVPLSGPQACEQALAHGVLLLDPAGAAVALPEQELRALAEGRVPVPGTALSVRTAPAALRTPSEPDLRLARALARALEGTPVRAARLLEGADGPVLGVVPDRPLDAAGLASLAALVVARAGEALPPVGVDLVVVEQDGPGVPLPLSRWRGWLRR